MLLGLTVNMSMFIQRTCLVTFFMAYFFLPERVRNCSTLLCVLRIADKYQHSSTPLQ
jgi:hypothetical protein